MLFSFIIISAWTSSSWWSWRPPPQVRPPAKRLFKRLGLCTNILLNRLQISGHSPKKRVFFNISIQKRTLIDLKSVGKKCFSKAFYTGSRSWGRRYYQDAPPLRFWWYGIYFTLKWGLAELDKFDMFISAVCVLIWWHKIEHCFKKVVRKTTVFLSKRPERWFRWYTLDQ